jgi:hypothetical protein
MRDSRRAPLLVTTLMAVLVAFTTPALTQEKPADTMELWLRGNLARYLRPPGREPCQEKEIALLALIPSLLESNTLKADDKHFQRTFQACQ